MNLKSNFLGREAELKQLNEAWSQAAVGNPQWVAITAETGVGKTRLVQEFYRQLAAAEKTSRMPLPGYWPAELPINRDKLGLNPGIDTFSEDLIHSTVEMPWLWWGLRGQGDVRNATGSGCAARDAMANLEQHCAGLMLKKVKEKAFRHVGVEAMKAVSSALGLGAVEAFFGLFEPGSAAYEGIRAVFAKNKVDIRAEKEKQSKKLQDQLTEIIAAFLNQQIPVILVLDDAQWLDADTVAFVQRLVVQKFPEKMKLMIISTSWQSDWHEAPIRSVYEKISHSKSIIPLKVADSESAETFLLARFPGLTNEDIALIINRSGGNYRYLEEISIELNEEVWNYFVDEDQNKNLSENGLNQIKSKALDIETLILKRFRNMKRQCQEALMHSSYQGRRFDPKLTSIVGQKVFESGEGGDPEKTLEALKLADTPGAMITEVEGKLREFLQGPYHRLIREKFDQWSKESKIRSVYHEVISAGTVRVADSIVEVVLEQWIDEVANEAEKIPLLARLLVIAVKSNRYQIGLVRLKKLASTFANISGGEDSFTPTIDSATSLAALRIFSQYAFGSGSHKDYKLLENFCLVRATEDFQGSIFKFIEDGTLPSGCDLRQLVTWCDALVNLSAALGHMHEHFRWLGLLCQLNSKLLDSDAPEPNDKIRYAASLLCYAEAQAPYATSASRRQFPVDKVRAKWDAYFNDIGEAEKSIYFLKGKEKTVFQAWLQISVLYFGREAPSHYLNMKEQDWGDDYQSYCRAAELLGETLCEFELSEDSDSCGGMMAWRDDLLEALLHASTLILEYALSLGDGITLDFLNRLRLVSDHIFKRLNVGIYVPTSLGFQAMESNLAVVSILHRLAERKEIEAAEIPPMLDKILAAVTRYRELGMLSMGMVETFVRASYDRLILTNAQTPQALQVFNEVLDDAVLTREGERAAFGESVQLLPWLVRIYDKWLAQTPEAEQLWIRLRENYRPCEVRKFQELARMIRAVH